MKCLLALPACLGLLGAAADAQIRVDSVVNAASYAQPGMPNEGVAQGSFASAFGAGLGRLKTSDEITLPLQTDWGGLTVRITAGGTTVNAWPVYSNGTQVNFIVPSNTPVGNATITISYNGQSASAQVRIVARNFGIFSVNSAGNGPGSITDANDRAILVNNSARAGQILNIWGTGLGPVSGNEAAGPLPGNMPNVPVEIWIGDKMVETIRYKGRSGCCIGLDQIQIDVPPGVTGCYVPVMVMVNDVVSNFTTLSIAPNGGTCSDPIGLTPDLISAAAGGGNVRLGAILLTRTGIKASTPLGEFTSNTDTGTGTFFRYNFDRLIRSSTGVSGVSPFGSCTIYTYQGEASLPTDIAQPTPLDAGASLQLTGPKGAKTLTKNATGIYSGSLGGGISGLPGGIPFPGGTGDPPYLDPGSYTVRGTGGADIGAFSAMMNVGTPLTWTNMDAITTVTRDSGVTVNWTGGEGYVLISGSSGITIPRAAGASFACFQRASAGTFTVPSHVLMALPATPAASPAGGILIVGNTTTPVPFTASGLDQGTFAAATTFAKTVTYR
jgi:uncharacterized protein (TIGR03437 family)